MAAATDVDHCGYAVVRSGTVTTYALCFHGVYVHIKLKGKKEKGFV